MTTLLFAPLFFFVLMLLSACGSDATGPRPSMGAYVQSERRGLVRSGNTIYQTMPNSSLPDYSRPMRQLQPGETFDPNRPTVIASPTPHAQTLGEGEALENQMAREAEEKARREQQPENQVRAEQDKIERQIQEDQEKIENQ
ncbi:MAG TPA: hypothetical protein VGD78_05770 [Chthoniobacterales bacterium]